MDGIKDSIKIMGGIYVMKLIILVGLPASGKTTWARDYERNTSNCKHIEFDKVCILEPIYFSYEDAIKGELQKNLNYDTVILDFIFYNNRIVHETINYSKEFNITEVELHYWIENRQLCLINDKIRAKQQNRKFSCEGTIKHKRLEKPNLELLKENHEYIEFQLIEHEVYIPF